MKTRKSILALLILLIVTGCSKEILEVVPQAESSEEKSNCVQDVNSAVVNPHATTYYELIKNRHFSNKLQPATNKRWKYG